MSEPGVSLATREARMLLTKWAQEDNEWGEMTRQVLRDVVEGWSWQT